MLVNSIGRNKTGASGSPCSRSALFPAILSILLLTAGCSSLPTEVQRTPSYVLEDTSGTRLARMLQPLLVQHPERSGFHTLPDGLKAYAVRKVKTKLRNMETP